METGGGGRDSLLRVVPVLAAPTRPRSCPGPPSRTRTSSMSYRHIRTPHPTWSRCCTRFVSTTTPSRRPFGLSGLLLSSLTLPLCAAAAAAPSTPSAGATAAAAAAAVGEAVAPSAGAVAAAAVLVCWGPVGGFSLLRFACGSPRYMALRFMVWKRCLHRGQRVSLSDH